VSTTRTNIAIASRTASLRFPADSPGALVPGASVMVRTPGLLKSLRQVPILLATRSALLTSYG
jgi:hypothetical protein